MAIYEVILKYLLHGKEVLNTFNYLGGQSNPSSGGAIALLEGCGLVDISNQNGNSEWWFVNDGIGAQIQELVSSSMRFVEAVAINPYDPTDFYQVTYTQTVLGRAAGTAASRFLTYPLWSNIVRRDVRRGQKGIPGVIEEYMAADGVIAGAGVAALQEVAAAMSDEVAATSALGNYTFAPCVVSKELYTPDESRPERTAYRYYEAGEAAQLAHIASPVIWSAKDKVSTRNSRKG